MERQGHVASDWELHGSSPSPASVEQDLEQMSGDPNEVQGNPVDSHPLSLPSQPIRSSLPNWDQESQHDNWTPHDMHQRLGIVCSLFLTSFLKRVYFLQIIFIM